MIEIIPKNKQAQGQFNGGEIIENKPVGFPQDGGEKQPYSNIFYWAYAQANKESTIGLHPHKGFEIITFVLKGSIRHYDTLLTKWIDLEEGDIQVIKSGSGVSHSEALNKDAAIFQIWFDPNLDQSLYKKAEYQDYKKEEFNLEGKTKKLIGNNAKIKIDSEGVEVYELHLNNEEYKIPNKENEIYSLYILEGEIKINKKKTSKDDFIIISENEEILITAKKATKIFCIKSNRNLSYPTYFAKYLK